MSFLKITFSTFMLLFMGSAWARSVYLNGQDISSAVNQNLKNVNVQVNDKGDIFISAPHYQVIEETAFVPLKREMRPPTHSRPEMLPAELKQVGEAKKAPDSVPTTPIVDKDEKKPLEPASELPAEPQPTTNQP